MFLEEEKRIKREKYVVVLRNKVTGKLKTNDRIGRQFSVK